MPATFHDAYTAIKAVDPTARFVISGIVQVSTAAAGLAGPGLGQLSCRPTAHDIPVDIWNIHTYVANEMHQEWGFEIPPGIPNAVGYSVGMGTDWAQEMPTPAPAAARSTAAARLGAKAYFAFHGSQVTVYLRTGPDTGIAELYLDRATTPVR